MIHEPRWDWHVQSRTYLRLQRTPQAPPAISPLPAETVRPKWSVMIPAYNCARYLPQTLRAVLEQAPGEAHMQIEVIDDCSTDADVQLLVQTIGKGRIGYYRQPVNVGSLRNFETCINRAKGELIHILHGDDYVKPGFYAELEALFTRHPAVGAAFTDFVYVDEESNFLRTEKRIMDEPGIVDNWLYRIAQGNRVQTPCMVVKRKVYEQLGSFYAVHYGEDWEMWIRIASKYQVAHSPQRLACYRVHKNNISSRSSVNGDNIRDVLKVIDICQAYLPAQHRKKLKRLAKKNFSIYFSGLSHVLYHEYQNPAAALRQGWDSVKMHANKITVLSLLRLYVKVLIRFQRRPEK